MRAFEQILNKFERRILLHVTSLDHLRAPPLLQRERDDLIARGELCSHRAGRHCDDRAEGSDDATYRVPR